MKLEKDAYGQGLMAYLKNKTGFEIVERDDGYISISSYGPKKYFSSYKDWPVHEKMALKLAKGKVLDVGCGAGRHSIYLQQKGLDVTDVDNSPLSIKVCQMRGLKKARCMSIDEVSRFRANSFDAVILLGNNFGLFSNFKKAKLLLKRFYKITSSQALIITESTDPHKTDKRAHLIYQKENKKCGRLPGQMRIRIRFEQYIGDWFNYLLVSKKEMKEILAGTNWYVKKFINTRESKGRYIAVVEKVKLKK